ncbi:hypothetical protein LTZ15_07930 [Lacticaseibacillus paracasei]|nr:hypothetical protein [Lacticaseibacillus paracasei]MDE3288114.1 hypothetical protein [Lacticaseibacillus paracasei]
MTETKRDVFNEVRYKFRNFKNEHRHGMYASPDSIDHYLSDALKRYAAALPDDLPVIPEEVSDRLKQAKADRSRLRYMFADSSINMLSDWWMAQDPENEDTFARSWVLGVWRVEETGEIVKLEEEK